ncbi:MAG: heparinase II/III family protein, partial [Gammaproteobacteria bacterium]|nr:heparinase II/III family protein [Gammaproteobacteria bacterium]
MAGLAQRLALYLRTVRWLRLSQLAWFVYRRVRGVINPPTVPTESSRSGIAATAFVSTPEPDRAELRFLNVAAAAEPDAVDWHPTEKSRLWRYNLHYFDYLQWNILPAAYKPRYIDSWLAANPTGCEDAWEPYTVSLRIVNWIKYCNTINEVPPAWQDSLVNQANWLTHTLEHHILANHYYKNAKALLFAGVWFSGDSGQRFLQQGVRLFLAQTAEQFLGDGGHYERAPMYHCIALEDLLDVLNLMTARAELFTDEDRNLVVEAASRAARWLDEVTTADGRIPLFNDSAHGVAPSVDALLDYAHRIGGYERLAPPRQPLRVSLPESGYYGYRHNNESLLIDCGRIGPGYQPGHTHCD